MRATGAFELHLQPAAEARPMRISVALVGAQPDERGTIHMTPDCMTLDDLEACINVLQDELDFLRVHARRAFTGAHGHA